MRTILLSILFLNLFTYSLSAFEAGYDSYKIKADLGRNLIDENKVELEGNVRITYEDAVIYCDRLVYNTVTKDFTATGKVRIVDQLSDFRSNEVSGNLETKLYKSGRLHLTNGPWFIIGNEAQSYPDRSIDGKKVRATTCDIHHAPHWQITGSEVHHMENGDFEIWNPVIWFGKVPVFWLPYMQSDIHSNDGMFKIVPGHDSDWGTFVLVSTKFRITKNITTTLMLDYRSKRGVGYGIATNISTERTNTDILLYGTSDSDADESEDFTRFDIPGSRYRIYVNHQSHFYDDRLSYRVKVNKLSDIQFMEDFFDDEIDNDTEYEQFNSFLDVTWLEENYALGLNIRPRVNDFYSAVERLPELTYDLLRYEIADKFYYSNHNSLSWLETKWREFDDPLPLFTNRRGTRALANNLGRRGRRINPPLIDNEDYDSVRFDSLHMFHYQTDYNNWLNLIPRAGLRLTYYSDSSKADINQEDLGNLIAANDPSTPPIRRITNYDDNGGSVFRLLGEIGFEANFKAYNTDHDYKSEYWEIDGLRHVVQPYVNWNWIPFSTEDRDNIYFFDEVDRITEQNFIRTGVENRWQTRREGKIHNFLTIENYVDFHLQSEEDSTGLGDFGTEIEWKPFERFSMKSELLVDLGDFELNEFRTSVSYWITDKIRTTIGYYFRDEYNARALYSNGSTIYNTVAASSFENSYRESHGINLRLSYLINPKTLILTEARYSFNRGGLVRYMIELQRKLHCWTMALRVERDRDNSMRYLIQFYLNAFPDVSFGT